MTTTQKLTALILSATIVCSGTALAGRQGSTNGRSGVELAQNQTSNSSNECTSMSPVRAQLLALAIQRYKAEIAQLPSGQPRARLLQIAASVLTAALNGECD